MVEMGDSFLAQLTPMQARLLKAMIFLIAFSSVIDMIWSRAFDVNTWYEYQGTSGPFQLTENPDGTRKVGSTQVNLVKPGDSVMIITDVCFKHGITQDFYRTVIRLEDDEIISTAERYFGPESEGCKQIRSILNIEMGWKPGRYEVRRSFVLSNGWFGRFSNYLPPITLQIVEPNK